MPVPGWIGAVLAGAAAGALGAMGLGGGGVLLLWLAFSGMDQLAAQGVNLFFILPVGVAGLWLHRKNGLVAWRAALPMGVGGLAGFCVFFFSLLFFFCLFLSFSFFFF